MKPTKTILFRTLIVAVLLVSVLSSYSVSLTYAATPADTNANRNSAGSLRPTNLGPAAGDPVLFAVPGGLNSGECSSWATACELRYVLPLAVSGQEIWVKAGSYKPTDSTAREIAFQLKAGVAVYGGFAGGETDRTQRDPAANVTVLSGDLNGDDGANFANNGDNSYHVVIGATNATLDGVTVSGGNANASNPYDRGGGILNNAANPMLANLIISDNAATVGAGMYNDAGSNPVLTNVTFNGNAASYSGGGMQNYATSNPTLNHVTLSSNSAQYGGGMLNHASSPTLTDVSFISNRATTQYGGGMFNEDHSMPALTNVTFKSNTAALQGGGMHNTASSPTLTNATFWDNSATEPNSWGGGMANWNGSSPILTNVTFSGNSTYWASGGGGGIVNFTNSRPQLRNCILWGNSGLNGPQVFNGSASEASTITDSVIPGCPTNSVCTNIITADPQLASLGSYGGETQTMALLPGSSAIDASNSNCPATDQRGIARSMPFCDIGAFESQGFTLAVKEGSPQSTGIHTAFATPLSVLVSSAQGEPVSGGRITFTPPMSGASAAVSTNLATIDASGIASVTATANGTVGGPYAVNASTAGANSINFTLSNLQTYTVTYHGNGSTGGSVPVDPGSPYVESETVTVLGAGTLVRAGHTFSGWNYQADGLGSGFLPDDTFLMPSSNVILYAQWTLNSYTVIFNSQSSTDVPSQTVAHGGLVTQPADPTRIGFTFNGWYTAASGGEKWDFGSSSVTAATTLYAQWTVNSYTVTFDSQSDSTVPDQTVAHGELVAQPADPTRAGYNLCGWYTAASGGEIWDFANNTVTSNLILYARWTDSALPLVVDFAAASPVNDYTIPITRFGATDNVAITGFMLTQSSTPPLAGDDGWMDTAPTTYTVSEDGIYILYPWVKDDSGNVSPVYDRPATVTVQKTVYWFLYLPLVIR